MISSGVIQNEKGAVQPLTVGEKIVWYYGGLLFFVGVMLAVINPEYFDKVYTLEDALLESLTVLFLGTVAFFSVRRVMCYWSCYSTIQKSVMCFVCLAFIFGTGEEISWGQRLFSIESAEFFLQNNAQAETNLHNLVVGETKINKLVFGKLVALFFIIYLFVISLAYKRIALVTRFVNTFAIPIPTRLQWWGYIVVLLAVEGMIHAFSDTGRRGELTEFAASALVMLTVLYPRNRQVLEPVSVGKTPLKLSDVS